MTQQLSQAISLLQYSLLELTTFLQEYYYENPLLEFDNYFHFSSAASNKHDQMIKNIPARKNASLQEQLKAQLVDISLSPAEMKMLIYLIYLLDEDGYLRHSENEIAQVLRCEHETVKKHLAILKELEPVGIGAHNLQECLLLQLKRKNPRHMLSEEILSNYFMPFVNKSWHTISKSLKIELQAIQAVHNIVETLNPRPGSRYHNEETIYIVPDISVCLRNNELLVTLNEAALPKITINYSYYEQYKHDQTVKKYMKEKLNQCHWLLASLEQRNQTILNVTEEIAKLQIDYFRQGPCRLKPLTLYEVASQLDIHESTVSRTVKGKFIQTPFGVVELSYFFSKGIKTKANTNASACSVKHTLQQIINTENKQFPLSDEKLSVLLKNKYGILLSRRTIAKYRALLNIPAARKRKRFD